MTDILAIRSVPKERFRRLQKYAIILFRSIFLVYNLMLTTIFYCKVTKKMSNYSLLIKQGSVLLLSLATVFATARHQKLEAQETEGNVTIEEVTEGEDVVVGEEVTVRGEATEVEPGVSFVMQEEGFLEGDAVLVINTSEKVIPEGVDELPLQVTGELGTLVLADVEREYGLDLDPELYVDYESSASNFCRLYGVVSRHRRGF